MPKDYNICIMYAKHEQFRCFCYAKLAYRGFFNPELQRQRLNIHQYSENDNVQTMRKMDDLHLVDFVELQLKSKQDFNTAYDIALGAGLGDYAKKFIIFHPDD